LAVRSNSPLRGHHREWEGYRGWCVRPACSILEVANFLSNGFDSFAERVDGRPVVLMDLIDHFYHDHIVFASGGSSNFEFLVYLVRRVQEIETGRGILQETLITLGET